MTIEKVVLKALAERRKDRFQSLTNLPRHLSPIS